LQDKCFPQTIAVCQTRASGLGLTVKVSDEANFEYGDDVCGVMVQYPATDGRVLDYSVSCTECMWSCMINL
jgi:glycine dehydrogenase